MASSTLSNPTSPLTLLPGPSPYAIPITSFLPGENVLIVNGYCDGQRGVGARFSVDFSTGGTSESSL